MVSVRIADLDRNWCVTPVMVVAATCNRAVPAHVTSQVQDHDILNQPNKETNMTAIDDLFEEKVLSCAKTTGRGGV